MKTLTKEMQASLTPEMALELLKEGNNRFVSNLKINRNLLQQVIETSESQYPFAVILSCMDSRTSAELIFDQGLGDIFSIRIAGNIINDDILGSMEYACKVVGSKIIVVLGHSNCGAIKGACDDVQLGKLTALIQKVKCSVNEEKTISDNRNSKNADFVNKVTALNVQYSIKSIMEESTLLRSMVENKEVAIVGGIQDISSGVVDFYKINFV